mmetsp:Transcript_49857/g.125001  ORF Transcript_49857/g.125001 Transcript_49857/m.125001 type:complete len:243 (+) Transcript_49857:583-1311(+)
MRSWWAASTSDRRLRKSASLEKAALAAANIIFSPRTAACLTIISASTASLASLSFIVSSLDGRAPASRDAGLVALLLSLLISLRMGRNRLSFSLLMSSRISKYLSLVRVSGSWRPGNIGRSPLMASLYMTLRPLTYFCTSGSSSCFLVAVSTSPSLTLWRSKTASWVSLNFCCMPCIISMPSSCSLSSCLSSPLDTSWRWMLCDTCARSVKTTYMSLDRSNRMLTSSSRFRVRRRGRRSDVR